MLCSLLRLSCRKNIEKESKTENGRVASPESAPIFPEGALVCQQGKYLCSVRISLLMDLGLL